VERTAKALAQRQAPGLVNARSKRRVDNELHAAAFVEEALGDYRGLRGNRPKQCTARYNIFDSLLRARIVEAAFGFEPIHRSGDASGISISIWRLARNKRADFLAELGNMCRKFVRARRRFAAPEGHVRSCSLRVFHENSSGLHAPDAPG